MTEKKKFGGRQEGAGRPKGSKNRSTLEFREEARQYTMNALRVLGEIINDKKASFLERIKAIELLFDRAYGKAPQSLHLEGDVSVKHEYDSVDDAKDAMVAAGIPKELAGSRLLQ